MSGHLDILDDNFCEEPDILIPHSSPEVGLGKLVSHLSHNQLNRQGILFFGSDRSPRRGVLVR